MRPAAAEGWHAEIRELENIPHSFLAIDKNKQQAHVLSRHSPLSISATYPCTTGKIVGDKQIQDDLKTPEGVYFVGQKLTALDFEEYGGIAYTLNYPNPVDRLRRKTGYGIWIHSKGHEIVPRETRGCIALNLPDLERIGDTLIFGYPVTVAHQIDTNIGKDEQMAATAELLEQQTKMWAKLWSDRSTKMFDLYHGHSYSLAQTNETFEHFTATKRRLFSHLAWIHTIIGEVKILPGPGYWVTWFNQFYRAPNLTTEGVRRLYWQEKDGRWLIVGMEWEPRDLGLSAHYLEVIEPELTKFIEDWRQNWLSGNVEEYSRHYAPNAVQGKLHSRQA
ncbi:MAG: L,D-transpeptidase family protein, partial [Desulfovibrionaceae bacterium]|nr:L,D-transpeptidase family protein [Desulfovibrionaceae bacterium]